MPRAKTHCIVKIIHLGFGNAEEIVLQQLMTEKYDFFYCELDAKAEQFEGGWM